MNKFSIATLLAMSASSSWVTGPDGYAPPSLTGREKNHYNKLARIKRTEARQRRGSQYARDHRGEPGRNGGPKGM